MQNVQAALQRSRELAQIDSLFAKAGQLAMQGDIQASAKVSKQADVQLKSYYHRHPTCASKSVHPWMN